MAVSARQVQVDLVRYVDSLRDRTLDYTDLDCLRMVVGWLPRGRVPRCAHTGRDWRRRIAAEGGADWFLGADRHLPRRNGSAKVGDIVARRDPHGVGCFGIARDSLTGYFLVVDARAGQPPVVLYTLDRTLPVWRGRLP